MVLCSTILGATWIELSSSLMSYPAQQKEGDLHDRIQTDNFKRFGFDMLDHDTSFIREVFNNGYIDHNEQHIKHVKAILDRYILRNNHL